ncbi:MAG: FAD binding domain-containing protein [Desulforhopalus sp.]
MLPKFSYVRPEKLDDVLSHLKDKKGVVHAGGTDLLGCLRERIIDGKTVVSLSALDTLKGIETVQNGAVRIGALTTITELSEDALVKRRFPGLAAAASEVASPQLRNQGTVGGNLCQKPRCWYYRGEFHCRRKGGDMCYALGGENHFHAIFGHDYTCAITNPSDTAPVFTALGATVQVAGSGGKRKIKIEDLYVLPEVDPTREKVLSEDEIISHIHIPAAGGKLYSSYRKIRARRSWDFALAGAALALNTDGLRIADAAIVLSGAAPVPWRSRAAESEIAGKELSEATIIKAARAAVADAVPLDKNGYKLAMFQGMLEEELQKAREAITS